MAPTDCCLQVDHQGNSPEQIDNNSQNLSNTLDFITVHSAGGSLGILQDGRQFFGYGIWWSKNL